MSATSSAIVRERFPGFDSLRCFIIFIVVALHAAMTYMAWSPQWWYVIDKDLRLEFTALVIITDTFPMTVLFLLAGYFTPPSLDKAGTAGFLKGKLFRLCLPWLLGMIFVTPFLARGSKMGYGFPKETILEFVGNDFFGVWYQQGPYWFLNVLMLFMTVYALTARRFVLPLIARLRSSAPSFALLGGIVAITALTHFLSVVFYKHVDEWTNIGYLVYFQPARFVGYICVFLFGVAANIHGWFTSGGWRPRLLPWGLLTVVFLAARTYWKIAVPAALAANPVPYGRFIDATGDSLIYAVGAVATTFSLIGEFLRVGPAFNRFMQFFNPYSFIIYWWHMPAVLLIMYAMLDWNVSTYVKFSIACVATMVICRYLALPVKWLTHLVLRPRGRGAPSR